jgi:hypothetical protein
MSYEIEALIGRGDILAKDLLGFVHARVIPLGQEIAIVPITRAFFEEVTGDAMATGEATDRCYGFRCLSRPLAALAERLSRIGLIGYIEAEFWGGVGTQWGIVWEHEKVTIGPYCHDLDAINKVLRKLGVQVAGANDEFDSIGLGRYRTTLAWVAGDS